MPDPAQIVSNCPIDAKRHAQMSLNSGEAVSNPPARWMPMQRLENPSQIPTKN